MGVPRWLSDWGLVGAACYGVAGCLVMFHLIAPLASVHIMLQATLRLRGMVLAIGPIAKGFNASAPASVASAGGHGGGTPGSCSEDTLGGGSSRGSRPTGR